MSYKWKILESTTDLEECQKDKILIQKSVRDPGESQNWKKNKEEKIAGIITNSKLTIRGGNNNNNTIFIRNLPVDMSIYTVITSDSNLPCQIGRSRKCDSYWVGSLWYFH